MPPGLDFTFNRQQGQQQLEEEEQNWEELEQQGQQQLEEEEEEEEEEQGGEQKQQQQHQEKQGAPKAGQSILQCQNACCRRKILTLERMIVLLKAKIHLKQISN
ncbi:probable basic-leucine zipper transcription factor K [Astyanax mexicanus]|uniref:probable basic-leucine zipper transcription factor K n=1 Tax=Astyanax mexicanus TaxID=7994 RepID=UPI0020CB2369|nr:probable basic-leucine zipper transcription factor K [Astyanax mexicanus]